MKKWPAKLGKALHALVPYVALVLTLHGQPECAAALQAIVGAPLLPPRTLRIVVETAPQAGVGQLPLTAEALASAQVQSGKKGKAKF